MSFRVPRGISPPGTPSPPRVLAYAGTHPIPLPVPRPSPLPPYGRFANRPFPQRTPHVIPSPSRNLAAGYSLPSPCPRVCGDPSCPPPRSPSPPLPPYGRFANRPSPPTHPTCHSESLEESRRRVLPPLHALAHAQTLPLRGPPSPPSPVGATLVVARPTFPAHSLSPPRVLAHAGTHPPPPPQTRPVASAPLQLDNTQQCCHT